MKQNGKIAKVCILLKYLVGMSKTHPLLDI